LPVLLVEKGNVKGERLEIEPGRTFTVGRDPRCHLTIEDGLASRHHFQLKEHKGRIYVRDLSSQNGTWLNDGRIDSPVALKDGDTLRAGETLFSYRETDDSEEKSLTGIGEQRVLGGYELIHRLGRGGMGVVYQATQLSLGRDVALKILAPKLNEDETFVKLFFEEARAAGRLNHPNIVQVYDVASEGDLNFISMELMEKGSVQDRLRRDKVLDSETAVAILLDAARGIQYAESKNLVHRDIKPDNLMINAEGMVKIADLGLAKSTHDGALGGDEGILGTPHFISPEQAQGKPLDSRADLYSLGATCYRIVTGETPFKGETAKEIVLKQIREEPRPVREVNPEVPEDLAAIIETLLAKDPDERFQDAGELIEALESVQKAHKYGRGSNLPMRIALAAVVLIAVAAVAWAVTRPGPGERIIEKTVVQEPEDSDPDAESRSREMQARAEFREAQLAETQQGRTAEVASRYDDIAGRFAETDYGQRASDRARTIRAEIAEKERLEREREQRERARIARLDGTLESIGDALRAAREAGRRATGLAAALRSHDPSELAADPAYAPRLQALLDEHLAAARERVDLVVQGARRDEEAGRFDAALAALDAALPGFAPAPTASADPDPAAPFLEPYDVLRSELEEVRATVAESRRDFQLDRDRDRFYPAARRVFLELVPETRYREALDALRALDALATDAYRERRDDLAASLARAADLKDTLRTAINEGRLEKVRIRLSEGARGDGVPVSADDREVTVRVEVQRGVLDQKIPWIAIDPPLLLGMVTEGLEPGPGDAPSEHELALVETFVLRGELAAAQSTLRQMAPGAFPDPNATGNGPSGPPTSYKGVEPPGDEVLRLAARIRRETSARTLRERAEEAIGREQWSVALSALRSLRTRFGDTREAIVHSDGTSHYYRD